jgi:hypothetical protein
VTCDAAPTVLRGRLSPAERDRIEILAVDHGLNVGQIASRMNRLVPTINSAMYGLGLKAPKHRPGVTYMRGGVLVVSFTHDEDAMIEQMRVDGALCREIAAACLKRFGRTRLEGTIRTRLKMLANYEGEI